MEDLMIDIECLATSYDAAIIQIGWARFDLGTGEVCSAPECYSIQLHSALKYGVIDPTTLKWWMTQSQEARESVFSEGVDLGRALSILATAARNVERIWACPPQFDLSILKNAYLKAAGTKQPWKHRKERCLRTLCDLVGYDRKTSEFRSPIPHNAGWDAQAQARQCIAAHLLLLHSIRSTSHE